MKKENTKKSQVSIFIIIALIIVTIAALIFVVIKKPSFIPPSEQDPQQYISNCLENSLEKFEKIILDGNGYLNITDNYILYSKNFPGEKVPYLCKVSQFYKPCINQEPMFQELVRRQIETKVTPEATQCFKDLISILHRAGHEVSEGNLSLEISFESKSLVADINKELTLKKNDQIKTYSKFHGEIQSPIYRLLNTEAMIINYESTLCEFNTINWMKYFPDISIGKFVASDSTKIYTLTDRNSNKKLSFAVKTCVLPAGI